MNGADVVIRFLMPSDPRYLSVVRAAAGELAAVCGLPEEECRAVTLAVDEAMANVIRHAYRGDPTRAIEVECEGSADRLSFTLLDQGEAPDPARLQPHPLNDWALSGRGTHLMKSAMDEVRYERVARGNQLRLSKRLPAAALAGKGRGL
jgi:anti-sigma regulatory factor (Ser/Thr protein kinase)